MAICRLAVPAVLMNKCTPMQCQAAQFAPHPAAPPLPLLVPPAVSLPLARSNIGACQLHLTWWAAFEGFQGLAIGAQTRSRHHACL
jgi:hypothetical protein